MSVSGQTQAKPESARGICEPCGFIYDPEEGDPDSGIDPGRPSRTSLTTGCAPSVVPPRRISASWSRESSRRTEDAES